LFEFLIEAKAQAYSNLCRTTGTQTLNLFSVHVHLNYMLTNYSGTKADTFPRCRVQYGDRLAIRAISLHRSSALQMLRPFWKRITIIEQKLLRDSKAK